MGGTIANAGSTPSLSTVVWAGKPAYGSASDAPVVGGGSSFGSAPTALQQPAVQSMLATAAPVAQPQPAPAPAPASPSAPTAAPTPDVQTALANLVAALQRLVAVLNAQQGAANVQGGGPTTSGCGCSGGAHAGQSTRGGSGAPAAATTAKPPAGGVLEQLVATART